MGDKIVVGPINKGLRNDVTPFNIDNDNFPALVNAYQWRGRAKRKRGTSLLGRLSRFLGTTNGAGNLIVSILPVPIGTGISSFTIGTDIFVDPGTTADPGTQTLITNSSGTGTLNRVTGVLTITGSQAATAVIYYPTLPVMGLEDLTLGLFQFPGTLAFDTVYSYNISTFFPYSIYDVSFYKNPPTGTYVGYVQKATPAPTTWNGKDYQQFWTVNYAGALWATNGINVPFSATNIGMQFKPIVAVTVIAGGPPATANLQITGHGLVVGDFVFVNEVQTTTGINFQTGYVITVVDANNVIVEFPNATIANNGTGGIAQYLTNRSDTTKDSLRWYDGDPTNGSATAPVLNGMKGWVNFAPPLSEFSYSIADTPPAQYYLVGARMIVPFKDRLLFVGPVIQTSLANSQIYLQDTVIYSQNGTPYYTASFTGDPVSAATVFHEILVPVNQTATASAYFEDQTGFGGFISAGVDQPITTASSNEDVLILGFDKLQTRFVYSGDDIVPFNFFSVNSELGSSSTFSLVNMDEGVITRGNRGFVISNQTSTKRIDLDIPDEVFESSNLNNGTERFCAQRDFLKEWIYFTYPSDKFSDNIENPTYKFPNTTLQYNYRDNSWAIFYENYTTYGVFRKATGFTWATVGTIYPTWNNWNTPWSNGASELLEPDVIAGNQQGFVMVRDDSTDEDTSLYIQNIAAGVVSSPNHSLINGDYIIITGAKGTIGASVNDKIFSVTNASVNSFSLIPNASSGTYLGGGYIIKLYVPLIQTKQFANGWSIGRKLRLGVQQYLLTFTPKSQISLQIFLSQNAAGAYNLGPVIPSAGVTNSSLVYTTTLYTCPESANLGLTPANTNLQMVTADQQEQIWHRVNTSLLGDSVQVGFTLSDAQMRSLDTSAPSVAITGITLGYPTILTTTGNFGAGLIQLSGILGTTQLNFNAVANNNYSVISSTSTHTTINVDSTAFTMYISGGIATPVSPLNQFAEIELHGFVIDVTPSMVVA